MRAAPAVVLSLVLALVMATPGFAPAGETAETPAAQSSRQADPCGFYRGQAYGRGLDHYATEMLWVCEAIAARREAAMTLGVRLEAAEFALERYRAAVIEAGAAAFARGRAAGPRSASLGAGETAKAALAESSGLLAALEGVRGGF